MRKQDNICKFITDVSKSNIYTVNFVFEKNLVEREIKMPENNGVYLVVSGKGILTTEACRQELQAGNIFFTFVQVPYSIKNTEGMTYMYITFNGDRCHELFSRFGITPQNCLFDGHESISAFWQNSIVKANQQNLDLISESVLLYTLGEMTQPEINTEQYLLGDILKYIEDNFSDCDVSLNSLAESLGYNSKYISRVFKSSMGITFSQYLTNVRIQHAVFLMEQGVTAIKNVAVLSGYKDPFYFSNVFKNVVGVAPSEFISKKNKK